MPDIVVPHFDNHNLATRPVFMDVSVWPHVVGIVSDYLRQEAIETIPWPAMSLDMNPIEHVSDDNGRKIKNTVTACPNFHELRAALIEEKQRTPIRTLQRLVQNMRRHVEELFATDLSCT